MKKLVGLFTVIMVLSLAQTGCKKEEEVAPNPSSSTSCTDGVMNGDETGIDCGGSCDPCSSEPSCTDGIMKPELTAVVAVRHAKLNPPV
jgi:hypothetical protein